MLGILRLSSSKRYQFVDMCISFNDISLSLVDDRFVCRCICPTNIFNSDVHTSSVVFVVPWSEQ